jgi:hypothetical protein
MFNNYVLSSVADEVLFTGMKVLKQGTMPGAGS